MLEKFYQVQLRDPASDSELVCWLPVDPRLKPGARVSLKELPDIWWTVDEVYRHLQITQSVINRHWRVGGLT